ncbi:Hemolysin activation/secretion protein [Noviherbaspirillum humi]|uniref:Hemolysin activation/secretion protein n=1 Tax=Noviherbaspirillum humi TaxID=1688639 RepID=A0A239I7F4_9BURK|nr:ShlB/FhaC/HecB family hemolysin secretion/activation protein [Noviherbaspirillum humi]SNS89411.1 Hemolysin activation/secretion protein [Noviherbaspirillum humi]
MTPANARRAAPPRAAAIQSSLPAAARIRHRPLLAVLLAAFGAAAQAQVPDAGSLLRGIEQAPPPAPPRLDAKPSTTLEAQSVGDTVEVRAFRISGNTLLPEDKLQQRLARYIGRALTLPQLESAISELSLAYADAGYGARAYLPPQDVMNGEIQVMVIEGRFAALRLRPADGLPGMPAERVRRYVEAVQQAGQPMQLDQLERGMTLLNDLAGVRANAALDAGKEAGDIDLLLDLRQTPRVDGSIDLANTGSRSTGTLQASGLLNLNNPFGGGDQANLRLLATQGSNYIRGGYVRPIGVEGWKLAVHAAWYDYRLGAELAATNAAGRATVYGASLSYPLVITRMSKLHFSGMLESRGYLNRANGATISDKQMEVFTASLSGGTFDGWMGGGYTGYGIGLATGRLALDNGGDAAADAQGPKAAGNYSKLGWNLLRYQSVGSAWTLSLSANGQNASKNLDSSEKLYLGGPSGVRAYPVNEGAGDHGWLLNAEIRRAITPAVQAGVFADRGLVQQHKTQWAGAAGPAKVGLSGMGASLSWSRDGWAAKAMMAWRIGENPLRNPTTGKDSDGSKRVPQIWLQLQKVF